MKVFAIIAGQDMPIGSVANAGELRNLAALMRATKCVYGLSLHGKKVSGETGLSASEIDAVAKVEFGNDN